MSALRWNDECKRQPGSWMAIGRNAIIVSVEVGNGISQSGIVYTVKGSRGTVDLDEWWLDEVKGCPNDTNGDGDCGQPLCQYCGKETQ